MSDLDLPDGYRVEPNFGWSVSNGRSVFKGETKNEAILRCKYSIAHEEINRLRQSIKTIGSRCQHLNKLERVTDWMNMVEQTLEYEGFPQWRINELRGILK